MFFLLCCRLNLIKRWLIIPRLTNPGSSTASFSPSLTPLMIRYVSRSLCSWHVLVKWILVKNNSTLFPVGGRCYLHDLHHRSAHRVCGHRADVQRPAQPQCQGCGQRTHEGLRYKTCLCCSSDSHGSATARYETLWPSQLPVNADMPTCWNDRCFFFCCPTGLTEIQFIFRILLVLFQGKKVFQFNEWKEYHLTWSHLSNHFWLTCNTANQTAVLWFSFK